MKNEEKCRSPQSIKKQGQPENHITATLFNILCFSHVTSIQHSEENIQLAALIMLHLFVTDHRLAGHCVPQTFVVRLQLPSMTTGSVVTGCPVTVSVVLSL